MNHLQAIASDHEVTVRKLSKQELEIGLACSRRVRKHLAKQVAKTNGNRYYQNLEVVEAIIQTYQKALDDNRIPMQFHYETQFVLSA